MIAARGLKNSPKSRILVRQHEQVCNHCSLMPPSNTPSQPSDLAASDVAVHVFGSTADEARQAFMQLAYCSIADQALRDQPAMLSLYAQAQQANAEHGITGLMMHHDGLIIQWIEGPALSVKRLWQQIKNDPRHHCIVKLLESSGEFERVFEGWGMQPATRQELLTIVRDASRYSHSGQPTPWAPVIDILLRLIDPAHSDTPDAPFNPLSHVKQLYEQRQG
jgi:hypothetical protein